MTANPEAGQPPLTTSDGVPIELVVASLRERDADRLVVRSEFACVSVRLVDPGGRPRLLVEDLRTRQRIELDAIELESLAWAHHQDLSPLLDPSARRWTNNEPKNLNAEGDLT